MNSWYPVHPVAVVAAEAQVQVAPVLVALQAPRLVVLEAILIAPIQALPPAFKTKSHLAREKSPSRRVLSNGSTSDLAMPIPKLLQERPLP